VVPLVRRVCPCPGAASAARSQRRRLRLPEVPAPWRSLPSSISVPALQVPGKLVGPSALKLPRPAVPVARASVGLPSSSNPGSTVPAMKTQAPPVGWMQQERDQAASPNGRVSGEREEEARLVQGPSGSTNDRVSGGRGEEALLVQGPSGSTNDRVSGGRGEEALLVQGPSGSVNDRVPCARMGETSLAVARAERPNGSVPGARAGAWPEPVEEPAQGRTALGSGSAPGRSPASRGTCRAASPRPPDAAVCAPGAGRGPGWPRRRRRMRSATGPRAASGPRSEGSTSRLRSRPRRRSRPARASGPGWANHPGATVASADWARRQ
jgi:hypothetical protein